MYIVGRRVAHTPPPTPSRPDDAPLEGGKVLKIPVQPVPPKVFPVRGWILSRDKPSSATRSAKAGADGRHG
eukprot:7087301-Prymnesium_polylepis.1